MAESPIGVCRDLSTGLRQEARVPFFEMPFHWLRIGAPRRLFWLGGPLLLYVWTLGGPFLSDDLNLILRAETYHRGETEHLDLYRFAATDEEWRVLRSRGTIPWWSPDAGRLDFLRPVSEWVFYCAVVRFGRNPMLFRAMSLLVFVLVLCSVRWMFIQACGDAVRAGGATFFFGISQTVTPPVTWMCNRQDLLVALGVSLSAGCYWAATRSPRWRFCILAVLAFLFALLSKEVAIALAAVVGLHEIIVRWRLRNWTGRPIPGVIAALLVLSAVAFLGYYMYSRPWVFEVAARDGAPSLLGSRLPQSLLLYAAVWTLGYPVDTLAASSPEVTQWVAAAGGLMLLVAAAFVRKATRRDTAALFFVLWAILFIVPGLRALTVSTRTLCTATIGWTYLIAAVLVPTRSEDTVTPLGLRQFFHATNGIVSICCAIATVLVMNRVEVTARERLAFAVSTMDPPLQDGDALILKQAESTLEMICAGDRLEFMTGRKKVCATYLLPPDVDAEVIPVDDRSVLLRRVNRPLLGSRLHRITRGESWRPKVGDSFDLSYVTISVSKLDEDGEVSELTLSFPRGVRDPRLHFDPTDFAARIRGESLLGSAEALSG